MLLTGPFAMLSMPSFDFHLPPCTEGFLIHLSPLWQLPLWQLPLFPSVAQFPCDMIGIFIIGQIMVILVSVSDRYQQNSQHLQISYNNLCATEIG